MAKAPFPIDPELTGIVLAYRNQTLVADLVLPRSTPLGKEEFTYRRLTASEGYTVPTTIVGRKSNPTEVEFTGTEVTDRTDDYGLDDFVPVTDVANGAGTVDPIQLAAQGLTDLIMLDREVRTANLVFASGTYAATNRATLSGTSQWSDFTNSNPVNAILAAIDIPLARPNVIVLGQATWTQVRQHPRVLQGVNASAQTGGAVTRQQFAGLFELEEVIVGQGFVNTARRGQTPTYARVWGRHAALIHRNPLARGQQNAVTFGMTFQYATRFAGQIEEPKRGLRGGTTVRVGESVKEVIMAADTGYYFENAVA
jgi:hypothetical protein